MVKVQESEKVPGPVPESVGSAGPPKLSTNGWEAPVALSVTVRLVNGM